MTGNDALLWGWLITALVYATYSVWLLQSLLLPKVPYRIHRRMTKLGWVWQWRHLSYASVDGTRFVLYVGEGWIAQAWHKAQDDQRVWRAEFWRGQKFDSPATALVAANLDNWGQ